MILKEIIYNFKQQPILFCMKLLENKLHCHIFPDKLYLSISYHLRMNKLLNWNAPKTFNEKLQWLKLYDRKPEYTIYVDKYAVRDYIAKTIGEEYLIPLLGVWDTPEEINFDQLPNQFVLKCNHDSGGLCICKDKSTFDIQSAKEKLGKSLVTDYYLASREWPYKNVPRKIIAEKYMEDSKTKELRDYKFFCFNGVVKALFVATDRQNKSTDTKFDFFDAEYNHLNFTHGHPNALQIPEKPKNFELMKKLAAQLAANMPHVRVDFYEINGKVYFGEMTFFHHSGFVPFRPEIWDKKFGSWLELPSKRV